MHKGRLEAFTDGVVAVIITIMVLEMKAPPGTDWAALVSVLPVFLTYVLSFVNVGIYWNNHHHMFAAVEHVDGRVLLANLFLLFWLSLVPFVIRWMEESHFAPLPTAIYGVVLGLAGAGYTLLQWTVIARNGRSSALARAVGSDLKGKLSLVLYVVAILLAFVEPRAALALYVSIALMWLVPDRRVEKLL